jgi:hypothetical protein
MTEQQKQDNNDHLMFMRSIQEDCFIDITKKISYPPVAISYGTNTVLTNGEYIDYPIPICTYGNFSFIQAPPKSMKTFFVSLLSSAFVEPNSKYAGKLNSFRKDRHLVHFDTEQGDWHSQMMFKRIQRMNPNTDLSFYHTFALRKVGYKSRVEFIKYYLESLKEEGKDIGLVIIDGVADLVSDVNNLEESNDIVQEIMSLTTIYDCHIVTVIHSNWGSDKPTGHLGSLLEKKTETQIKLAYDTLTKSVSVNCMRSRNSSFDPFSFNITEGGLPMFVENDYPM